MPNMATESCIDQTVNICRHRDTDRQMDTPTTIWPLSFDLGTFKYQILYIKKKYLITNASEYPWIKL